MPLRKLQSSAKERHQNRKIAKSRVVRTRSTDGSILIKAENAPDTYCDRFEEACLIRQTTHDILPPGTITPDELSKLDLEKTKAFTAVTEEMPQKRQRFIRTTESDPAHTIVFHDELWDTLDRADTKRDR